MGDLGQNLVFDITGIGTIEKEFSKYGIRASTFLTLGLEITYILKSPLEEVSKKAGISSNSSNSNKSDKKDDKGDKTHFGFSAGGGLREVLLTGMVYILEFYDITNLF